MPSPSANAFIELPSASGRVPGIGAHPEYDGSLLFCRMARLHIDRDRLAIDDPLLFRELQGRCALCVSKRECIRELASNPLGNWPAYCPNSGTLNLLEAVGRCSGARHTPGAPA